MARVTVLSAVGSFGVWDSYFLGGGRGGVTVTVIADRYVGMLRKFLELNLKAKVFEHHPRTIDELKAAIRQKITAI